MLMADDLSDAQVKAFRIADNKVSELASWNEELLEAELAAIKDTGGIDMGEFGFTEDELDALDDVGGHTAGGGGGGRSDNKTWRPLPARPAPPALRRQHQPDRHSHPLQTEHR